MRVDLFSVAIIVLACGSSDPPPIPGEKCLPNLSAASACYNPKTLVVCVKQSDGEYRWFERPCTTALFPSDPTITEVSCSCSRPPEAKGGYTNFDERCNCWGTPGR
jgi:hypothetical protein